MLAVTDLDVVQRFIWETGMAEENLSEFHETDRHSVISSRTD